MLKRARMTKARQRTRNQCKHYKMIFPPLRNGHAPGAQRRPRYEGLLRSEIPDYKKISIQDPSFAVPSGKVVGRRKKRAPSVEDGNESDDEGHFRGSARRAFLNSLEEVFY